MKKRYIVEFGERVPNRFRFYYDDLAGCFAIIHQNAGDHRAFRVRVYDTSPDGWAHPIYDSNSADIQPAVIS